MTVTKLQTYPLADRNTPWDSGAAIERLKVKAGGPDKDNIDWNMYSRFFMWYKENPSKFSDFKLPFVDVIGNKLHIVPKAIFAITGGRGINITTGIKSTEELEIKTNVCKYYRRMRKQFDDNTIACPFEDKQEVTLKGRFTDVLRRFGFKRNKIDVEEIQQKWNESKKKFSDSFRNIDPNIISFNELDKHDELKDYILNVDNLTWAFMSMMENILFGLQLGADPILIDGNSFEITIDQVENKIQKLIKEFEERFSSLSPFGSSEGENNSGDEEDINVGLSGDEDMGSPENPQVLNTIRSNVKEIFKSPKYIFENDNVSLFKDNDGQAYLYGKMTNSYKDSDEEVLTEQAHKKYIDFLDRYPSLAPPLWSFHTPGTERKSKAIWWDYSDNFLHLVWPLTKEEEEGIHNFCKEYVPAMSHGFYVLDRDVQENWKITNYVTFEGTLLPLEFASNKFTRFIMTEHKEKGFSPARRNTLVALHGEDFVKALEEESENAKKKLENSGHLSYKEVNDKENENSEEVETNILQENKNEPETQAVEDSDLISISPADFQDFGTQVLTTLNKIVDKLNDTETRINGINTVVEENARQIKEVYGDRQKQKNKGTNRQSALELFTDQLISVVGDDKYKIKENDPLKGKGPKETDVQEAQKNSVYGHLAVPDNNN